MVDPWTGKNPDRGLNPLDGTLESVLERLTDGKLATFEVARAAWNEVVSETWRERSQPVRLENGVLTVEVSDGGAASRLRLEQGKIKAALEQHLGRGAVAQIRLRVRPRSDRRSSP
ncbi:MAG: DUF721 domain-containing protein [Acidimicrobiia bacterium]|nr:DUF721 domain-containing protein [Acidimicrobiia bacterium]